MKRSVVSSVQNINKRSDNLSKLFNEIYHNGISFSQGKNLIAYSGGVDSSVIAAAVYNIFPYNTTAVIGISASLPTSQLILARDVAKKINIPLHEFNTNEGISEQYLCKSAYNEGNLMKHSNT